MARSVDTFERLARHLENQGCESRPTSNGLRLYYQNQLVWGYHRSHRGTDHHAIRQGVQQVRRNGFPQLVAGI